MNFWIVYGTDEYNEIIGPELYANEDNARARRDKLDEEYEYCARIHCEQISPPDVNSIG